MEKDMLKKNNVKRGKDEDKYRLLGIFYRAIKGQAIRTGDMAYEYDRSSKTIERDLSLIRNFLADNQAVGDKSGTDMGLTLEYDRKEKGHKMNAAYFLSDEEMMALVRILIGSRALSHADLEQIISKLGCFATRADRRLLDNLLKKEKGLYCEIHTDCESLLKNHWQLTKCIERGREITIRYLRMDRAEIDRRVRPLTIMFTDYYFYLVAEGVTEDEKIPKYYRIDRITKIEEHDDVQLQESFAEFDEEQLRKKSLLMWPGPARTITFEFTGPSLQAVLDKLPTAVLKKEEDGKYIVEAEVYGNGIKMFLLSQGSWVKVLGPESFVCEMREEIQKMRSMYDSSAAL